MRRRGVESLEVPFDTWDEPGLGTAMGFACRLPTERRSTWRRWQPPGWTLRS